MKLLVKNVSDMNSDDIFGMSTVRGIKVNVPHRLPFSFYFSSKRSSHGIRVRPIFNPNRMIMDDAGNLELHGEWKYTQGRGDKHINKKQKDDMINFFKEYKVLFAAVWEEVLQEDVLQDYFRGTASLSELIYEFDFYSEYEDKLDKILDVRSLEKFVRKYDVFNMND